MGVSYSETAEVCGALNPYRHLRILRVEGNSNLVNQLLQPISIMGLINGVDVVSFKTHWN